jgi:hypothetical protein
MIDPDEILDNVIVTHNKVHFSQAGGCVFSSKDSKRITDSSSALVDPNHTPEIEQILVKKYYL